MKTPRWKYRRMTVWEKVGAAFVAAVLLTALFQIARYLISILHSHLR